MRWRQKLSIDINYLLFSISFSNIFILASSDLNQFFFTQTYKKVQMINLFLRKKKSPRMKDFSEKERIDYLVTTLRFESKKTLCLLSGKMTQLSADLVQV